MDSLGLAENVCKALHESLSITLPTPVQQAAIPVLLKDVFGRESVGVDVVIQAQTGSGKTLAYALPLLCGLLGVGQARPNSVEEKPSAPMSRDALGTLALVIVPTRELAVQTQATMDRVLSRLRPHWIITTALTGGDSRKSEKARLRKGCHVVIGTPGRLLDHLRTSEGWKRDALKWVIVDEADRLADMGFEVSVKNILQLVRADRSNAIRMVLLSATVTEGLKREFAGRRLFHPQFIKSDAVHAPLSSPTTVVVEETGIVPAEGSFAAPACIEQIFLHVPTKLRLMVMIGLLREMLTGAAVTGSSRVIVFFTCCDSVDYHYRLFTIHNDKSVAKGAALPPLLPPRVKVLKLHGNMEQSERLRTFREFSHSKPDAEPTVLFCTDVAARGLDFPSLSGSIQYDAPCDMHDYIHRAGRTGRMSAGAVSPLPCKSVLFLMPSEEAYVERLATVGMQSLKKEPFDGYLKWVERFDAKKLAGLLKMLKRTKGGKGESSGAGPEASGDDAGLEKLPSTIRSRLVQLQQVLEAYISSSSRADLLPLATNGFLATVRAYATHPSAEKDIFHVKRLHLGHLAAAFGLDREPKAMAAHSRQSAFEKRVANESVARRDKSSGNGGPLSFERRSSQPHARGGKRAKVEDDASFEYRLPY